MIELLDAAIDSLENPRTLDADSRHWENILMRNVHYLSEGQIKEVKELLLKKHADADSR